MTTKSKKLKYGNVELDADEFDRKHSKVRITMMVDADVLEAFRAEAVQRRVGYQTLMNQKLREAVSSEANVEERLKALEKIVLKRMA